MVKKAEVLALIPARGGSKGILHKNIKNFAGYPLIAYSIAAAKQAETVTRVIVSTDDEKIAAIAREWGAETPFMRPSEFAQDNTLDLPVFRHALTWLSQNERYQPDIVVQLRPTSPFRPKGMIDEGVRLLLGKPDADSVRGVVPSTENPYKMWRIDSTGKMRGLLSVPGILEPYNAPRQVLPTTYWQTGHIDVIRPERTFMAGNSMSGKVILPLMIHPKYTVDIDTPQDWRHYEQIVPSLDIVTPGSVRRPMPEHVKLLALDFDGVMTDDRVFINENGVEMVVCKRADGMGISRLKKMGVRIIVISSEENPVVKERCKKLGIESIQGVGDKAEVLNAYMQTHGFKKEECVFVGNDLNDLPAFEVCGYAVAPSDAKRLVRARADIVLTKRGGHGAVREICEMILEQEMEKNDQNS